jgi:hypothetical protein
MDEQKATKNPDNARLIRVNGSFQLSSRSGIAGKYMSVETAAMAVSEPRKTIIRIIFFCLHRSKKSGCSRLLGQYFAARKREYQPPNLAPIVSPWK